ncbi:hypothetical protein QP343_04845 [Lactobacillus jensenii]|jgi:hypothetical protein|uniref:Uncharacterized protein n=1 Tax=Lactobacillus jensenii TaxID=109790 RepID=A0A5N1ICQ8_LACJE|nr:hypothetical protein [Lactobacillus jensenii]EEQ68231.1 hypothetical protein LBJG_00659 [Lactobacillus jensenii 1153]ERJ44289.1 hypothetical protein N581_07455 [Lactobacillus jensenii MD IIE-70(2)]APT15025.1 hypothetical protein BUE77_06225 [Lactobacillus jensenii]EEQ25221.1 hypothetical protein LACJE0001_0124 [Lactobacillus jensenii 269-3]EEX26702.1 hypothetical protein HMPREF0527_01541 [Lactobacillus jensenii SJ-7A-US]
MLLQFLYIIPCIIIVSTVLTRTYLATNTNLKVKDLLPGIKGSILFGLFNLILVISVKVLTSLTYTSLLIIDGVVSLIVMTLILIFVIKQHRNYSGIMFFSIGLQLIIWGNLANEDALLVLIPYLAILGFDLIYAIFYGFHKEGTWFWKCSLETKNAFFKQISPVIPFLY